MAEEESRKQCNRTKIFKVTYECKYGKYVRFRDKLKKVFMESKNAPDYQPETILVISFTGLHYTFKPSNNALRKDRIIISRSLNYDNDI